MSAPLSVENLLLTNRTLRVAWHGLLGCNFHHATTRYERKCVIVWNSFILVRQTSQPMSLSLSISTLFFMMSIGKYDPSVMLRLSITQDSPQTPQGSHHRSCPRMDTDPHDNVVSK